jgi:hypothetical protein
VPAVDPSRVTLAGSALCPLADLEEEEEEKEEEEEEEFIQNRTCAGA